MQWGLIFYVIVFPSLFGTGHSHLQQYNASDWVWRLRSLWCVPACFIVEMSSDRVDACRPSVLESAHARVGSHGLHFHDQVWAGFLCLRAPHANFMLRQVMCNSIWFVVGAISRFYVHLRACCSGRRGASKRPARYGASPFGPVWSNDTQNTRF